jgi:hypothetical protein
MKSVVIIQWNCLKRINLTFKSWNIQFDKVIFQIWKKTQEPRILLPSLKDVLTF